MPSRSRKLSTKNRRNSNKTLKRNVRKTLKRNVRKTLKRNTRKTKRSRRVNRRRNMRGGMYSQAAKRKRTQAGMMTMPSSSNNIILIVDLFVNDDDDMSAIETCDNIFLKKLKGFNLSVYDNVLRRMLIGGEIPYDGTGTVFVLSGMHEESNDMLFKLAENYNMVFQNGCDFVENPDKRDRGLPSNVRANKYFEETVTYSVRYKQLMDKLRELESYRNAKGLSVTFIDYPRDKRNIIVEQYSPLANPKYASEYKKEQADSPLTITKANWNPDLNDGLGKFVPAGRMKDYEASFLEYFPATIYCGYPDVLSKMLGKYGMDEDIIDALVSKAKSNYPNMAVGKYGSTSLSDLFCVLSVVFHDFIPNKFPGRPVEHVCMMQSGKVVVEGDPGNLSSKLEVTETEEEGFHARLLKIQNATTCLDTYFKFMSLR